MSTRQQLQSTGKKKAVLEILLWPPLKITSDLHGMILLTSLYVKNSEKFNITIYICSCRIS